MRTYKKKNSKKETNIDNIFFQCCTCAVIILMVLVIKKVSGNDGNITIKLQNAISKNINREDILFLKDIINKVKDKIDDKIPSYTAELDGEKWIMPCEGKITSIYGERDNPLGEERQFHDGIDIEVDENTEVVAVNDGVVINCGKSDTYGINITYKTTDGFEVFYAHLNKIIVKEKDVVKKGEVVAFSGNTGLSTGPHLHFEVYENGERKNPLKYLGIEKI